MPLPVLVVHRHAALEELAKFGGTERLVEPCGIKRLGLVEQEAPVAVGAGDKRLARRAGEGKRAFERLGPRKQLVQRLRIEPVEDQHLRAAEQRRVQLEAGILGGGAHQRHRAALDIGQETVLLRAVEAVDLVHEQQRALARLQRGLGFGEDLLEIGHAREHRADRHEAHVHRIGEQAGDAGLARARRAPQHHAREPARRHHPADRALGSGDVLLPDHLAERARSQAIGQGRICAGLSLRGCCYL